MSVKRVETRHWAHGVKGKTGVIRSERTCSGCGHPVGFFTPTCRGCGQPITGREVRDEWDD